MWQHKRTERSPILWLKNFLLGLFFCSDKLVTCHSFLTDWACFGKICIFIWPTAAQKMILYSWFWQSQCTTWIICCPTARSLMFLFFSGLICPSLCNIVMMLWQLQWTTLSFNHLLTVTRFHSPDIFTSPTDRMWDNHKSSTTAAWATSVCWIENEVFHTQVKGNREIIDQNTQLENPHLKGLATCYDMT